MDYSLSVHVVAGAEQFFHVTSGHIFAENLVSHGGNLVKQLTATNVLHDKVNVFVIDVSLVVLYDVGMVQLSKNLNFFLYCFKMVLEFVLIHDFNGDLVICVVLVVRQKNFPERT